MCTTLCEGQEIQPTDLALPETADSDETPDNESVSAPPEGVALEEYLENIERQAILKALDQTGNNKTAAAKQLGITFRAMRYRLKKLGLEQEK